ncbi:MAG: hypothetical protein HQL16_03760 [Candidatus Omnitrophica bacterium]|nr:hypothetical protein [Candidatus Omnitrophota bacterium]
MAKKNNFPRKSVPQFKKSVKDFLADEDGFVSKETILKVGLTTVAGIGMLGAMSSVGNAGHTNHTSHSNALASNNPPAGQSCVTVSHNNFTPHTSHSSY